MIIGNLTLVFHRESKNLPTVCAAPNNAIIFNRALCLCRSIFIHIAFIGKGGGGIKYGKLISGYVNRAFAFVLQVIQSWNQRLHCVLFWAAILFFFSSLPSLLFTFSANCLIIGPDPEFKISRFHIQIRVFAQLPVEWKIVSEIEHKQLRSIGGW